MQSADHHR